MTSRKTFPVYDSNGSLASGSSVKVYVTGETPASHPSGEWTATEIGSSGIFYVDLDNGLFDFYIDGNLYAHNTNRWVGGSDLPDKDQDENINGTWSFVNSHFVVGTIQNFTGSYMDLSINFYSPLATVDEFHSPLATVDDLHAGTGLVTGTFTISQRQLLGIGATLYGLSDSLIESSNGQFGTVNASVGTFGTILNLPSSGGGGSVFDEILVGTKSVLGKDSEFAGTELFSATDNYAYVDEKYAVGSYSAVGADQGYTIKKFLVQNGTEYPFLRYDATVDDGSGTLTITELRFGMWGGTFDVNGDQYNLATTWIGNGRYANLHFFGSNGAQLDAGTITFGTREDQAGIKITPINKTITGFGNLDFSANGNWIHLNDAVMVQSGQLYSNGSITGNQLVTATSFTLGSAYDMTATTTITNADSIGTVIEKDHFSGDIEATLPRGVLFKKQLEAGTVVTDYMSLMATTDDSHNTIDTFQFSFGNAAATEDITIGASAAKMKLFMGTGTLDGKFVYNTFDGQHGVGTLAAERFQVFDHYGAATNYGLQITHEYLSSSDNRIYFDYKYPLSGTMSFRMGGVGVMEIGDVEIRALKNINMKLNNLTSANMILGTYLSLSGSMLVGDKVSLTTSDTYVKKNGTTLEFWIDGTLEGHLDPASGWVQD